MKKPEWALSAESIAPRTGGYPAREEWGDGPWQDEPDKVEWRDGTGYALLIVRGPWGALCGYVGLPPEHPLHGKGYNDDASDSLSVHGGLTFAGACHEGGHICHMAQPGEPDEVWWLGFDCNHAGDFDPGGQVLRMRITKADVSWKDMFPNYRTLDYVREQVESLAAQCKALA